MTITRTPEARETWENEIAALIPEGWDGDDSQLSVIYEFVKHYAALDAEIRDALEDDEHVIEQPIVYAFDTDEHRLVRQRNLKVGEEWAVEFPAGTWMVTDDEGEASEAVQWVVDGALVRREVYYGPWERTPESA